MQFSTLSERDTVLPATKILRKVVTLFASLPLDESKHRSMSDNDLIFAFITDFLIKIIIYILWNHR